MLTGFPECSVQIVVTLWIVLSDETSFKEVGVDHRSPRLAFIRKSDSAFCLTVKRTSIHKMLRMNSDCDCARTSLCIADVTRCFDCWRNFRRILTSGAMNEALIMEAPSSKYHAPSQVELPTVADRSIQTLRIRGTKDDRFVDASP